MEGKRVRAVENERRQRDDDDVDMDRRSKYRRESDSESSDEERHWKRAERRDRDRGNGGRKRYEEQEDGEVRVSGRNERRDEKQEDGDGVRGTEERERKRSDDVKKGGERRRESGLNDESGRRRVGDDQDREPPNKRDDVRRGNGGHWYGNSESSDEDKGRWMEESQERARLSKRLENEEVGGKEARTDGRRKSQMDDKEARADGRSKGQMDGKKKHSRNSGLESSDVEKVRRMERREREQSGKGLDKKRTGGHRDRDLDSSDDEKVKRMERREKRERQQSGKRLEEYGEADGRDKMRTDDKRNEYHRDVDSESSDEEKLRRVERREKEPPGERLEKDTLTDGRDKRRVDTKRKDSRRDRDPVSSDEEKDRRSARQEREQSGKRLEEEDDKKVDTDGFDRKRRDDRRRARHHRYSDSDSSGGEAKRRRRQEMERRRLRSDDSSDSGGRRKRDRRDERRDRSRKDRRHPEDREFKTRNERYEKQGSDSKQDGRDKKREEAAKPEIQPTATNDNPGGPLATLGRTGGVYVPPFKLARMMKEIEDKSSAEYQRLTWDALRKSINGLVNKVNATNIKNIIPELFGENLIRGRGLFCRSCMKSQMASPGFTDVFAALVAVVNTKFPEIGELLLRRIILQLKRAYKRNDKPQLIAAVKFIAHLVNQQVAHELVALELLTVLLEQPTDDSVEVAVDFVKECGSILQDLCPKGLHGIFERFRGILHEGEIDKRVQFLIEGLFVIRKAKFQGHPAVRPELDLVEPEDQLVHEVSLDDEIDPETSLDIFRHDPNFLDSERKYEELKKSILGDDSDDEEDSDAGSGEEGSDEDDEDEDEDEEQMQIKDATETNLINLRRTIYLTIMSSVDFEEAGHKLLKIKLEPGQEMELCIMLLECCSQERTYLRYYGLLGQRFCMINKVHQDNFEQCFVQQYSMIHRLETNKLRNVAKFFAHLLGTDALPWHVLGYIRLTEEDTTSSSRIFIKILFQELSEHLGIRLLNERLNDPLVQETFESIFPKDNPRNTRFAINFFTSIGLGGLTENLREHLKNMPRMIMQQQNPDPEDESDSGSGSGSGSGSSDSASSSSESESESESSSSQESDSDDGKRRKRRKRN